MLVGTNPRRVAIIGGVRIPFARGNGAYAQVGNQEMLTQVLRGLAEKYGLMGETIDDVAELSAFAGAAPARSGPRRIVRGGVVE